MKPRVDLEEAHDLAGLLESLCRGKPSDAQIGLLEADAQRIRTCLVGLAKASEKGAQAKRRGLTSRSKLNRKPDTPYLAFVRLHPCCSCGATRDIEAHHTGRRGMGQKAADSTAVPLCRGCHRYFHDHGHLPVDGTSTLVARTIASLLSEWQESA